MRARGIALTAAVGVLASAACTPNPSPEGPSPNVTGTWTLQGAFFAPGDSDGTAITDTLELTGMVMTLHQSGTAFTGTFSGAVIAVFSNKPYYEPPAAAPISGSIVSGTATGATVVFSVPSLTNQPFEGVLNDSAMQGGTAISYMGSSLSTEKFTGGWTATKN